MVVSQNGYVANDLSRTQSWKIPGTSRAIRLRKGSPGAILVHFAAWFDKNIEDIEAGQLDDWGYAERPIRGSTTTLSNHASGTAMDLNATKHPLGARGTFSKTQAAKIRAKLKEYDGCIRWGGDYTNRADEMHFEIDRSPETCDVTLRKVTANPPAGSTPSKTTVGGTTLTSAEVTQINNYTESRLDAYFTWMATNLTQQLASIKATQINHTNMLQQIKDDVDDGSAAPAKVAGFADLGAGPGGRVTPQDIIADDEHPEFVEVRSAKEAMEAAQPPAEEGDGA